MFGGGGVPMDKKVHPHDFIELSPKSKCRIYRISSELYKKGLSLRDIEERTGIPKSTIRETLQKNGFVLRSSTNGKDHQTDHTQFKSSGQTPYGYAYLDGKLIIDPKEYLIVLKVMKLYKSGKSSQSIAENLNDQKILSRRGLSWRRCVISTIIKRQNEIKE